MLQIVLKKNKRGKWYLVLMAANNKIVLVSEDYHTKTNAVRAAKRLFKYFPVSLTLS